MKVISVGLISLIIFNIVLAKNSSDSGATTDCVIYENTTKIHHIFQFCIKNTKKSHKTTNEPVNVKGKGPYEEDYEENYEDMIKDIFMPLKNNHQYSQNNSHKQGDAPPLISKGHEKRQLRTINENNKIYQKPKDLLCTDPEKNTKTESKKPYSTPGELYKQNKDLLCTNRNETINAAKLMNEAATHLERHIKSSEDYEVYARNSYYNRATSIKKCGDKVDQIINFKYGHIDKYNEIINLLWDPALANKFNPHFVKRKIVRVYSPNLVIIQQRYKSSGGGREKYFYALAAKVEISKEKTIIVMASANINDHNSKNKDSYKNTIIENANLFTTDIDSENDIRKGKLKKTFVNIAGYLIEKKDARVNIGYLESINGHASNYPEFFIEKALNKFFHYKK